MALQSLGEAPDAQYGCLSAVLVVLVLYPCPPKQHSKKKRFYPDTNKITSNFVQGGCANKFVTKNYCKTQELNKIKNVQQHEPIAPAFPSFVLLFFGFIFVFLCSIGVLFMTLLPNSLYTQKV